jgi:murein DD-endopeptidase MepM/ murein hydrolase activator NlpD
VLSKTVKIFIVNTMAIISLNANVLHLSNGVIPGDDKKSKKREDTTRYVIHNQLNAEDCDEDMPDTMDIGFPSHDLYASWDTETAHPYNFNEAFREDSVVIDLLIEGENPFSMPYYGPLTSLFGWRKYRPHYGTDINLETGDLVASCFDGMVRVARFYRGYGNCVIVTFRRSS